METHDDEGPPTVFRASSPEMVFANDFTDSDDEVESGNSFLAKEMPSPSETKRPDLFDEHENPTAEKVKDISQIETNQEQFDGDSETEAKFDSSSPLADVSVNGPMNRTKSERSPDYDSSNNDPAKIETSNNDPAKIETSNNDPAKIETRLQQHQHPDANLENFASGWTLYEDDLICLPLISNKARSQEYLALEPLEQSTPLKRPHSDKGQKVNAMRRLKRRAGKGSSRLVFISPFSMIADIAKQNGYDLPTLLETSEFIGGPSYQLPCMQCYEKFGGKGGTDKSSLSWTGSSNGRCSSCGGQVQTMASYGKMIRQMRDVIEAKDLVPYDVYPDGNCLFAAIVDQLRVRGDFSFTPHSLRKSAVNYLRKNPTADDETPLHMFLTDDETWESYLARMSEDGEWGDHMILSALTNVINMQIVIYGGLTGQRETVLLPKHDEGMKSDAERDLQEDRNVVYLGHVGESHYMSLRLKGWRQSLREDFRKRSLQPPTEDCRVKCPVQHINFIFRQVFRMDFIKSSCSEYMEIFVQSRFEEKDYIVELFGSVICMMVPCKVKVEDFGPDISMFFPSVKEEAAEGCFEKPIITRFETPNDTKVVTTDESAGSIDLIAENDSVVVGWVLLIPKKPKIWKGQTTYLNETKICLKTFEINFCYPEYDFIPKHAETIFDVYSVLSFKCAWPDVAKEWPQRFRKSTFPDQQTIQTVVESGCHVIPLMPNAKMADVLDDPVHFLTSLDDHSWCYSFVAAEKEISRFFSSEQRQCFLIFKYFVNSTLRDIPLPSSVVRSIFFYACEKIDKQYWKSKPGECLLILLKKISECFRDRHVPHYFMREKNLLLFISEETLGECYDRLNCARLQPVVTLYFLLDQLNIMSTEIGSFVEEVIENINMDDHISAEIGLSHQALLPACTELLQNLIYQEDYHGAMLVFQDVKEEQGSSLITGGVAVLKDLLWDMQIGYQWSFALYVDMKQQTALTSQLCEGYDTVHITDVFGPDCTKELPSTLVPECFSIPKGDLIFLNKVSQILSQNLSTKMYIGCIKFYLKQYAKLAGEALVLPTNNAYHTRVVSCVCGSCKMRSLTFTNELLNIYVSLFNFCHFSYKTEEFGEMMPGFAPIAERVGSRSSLNNLKLIWTYLGERQKAAEISRKLSMLKGGNLQAYNLTEYD